MNEPRPFFSPDARDRSTRHLKVMEQGVDERSGPVSRSGMHHNTWRFVENQQLIVFKEHFQWNRLALKFKGLGLWDIHRDSIAWFDLLTGPHDLVVDADAP